MNPDVEYALYKFLMGTDENVMDWASHNGYLELVKYLYETLECAVAVDAMWLAALGGHIHVVRYLHETVKAPCTEDAMEKATVYRHFEVMAYLFEKGLTSKPYAELPEAVHELLRKSAKEAFRRAVRKARYVAVFNRLLVRVRFRPGGDGAKRAKEHFEQCSTQEEEEKKKRARIS